MQEEKMSPRIKGILRELCRQDGYVTIAAIAAALGVSGKTVLRELGAVESWLKMQGWELLKKTGAGVALAGGEAVRQEAFEAISGHVALEIYSPQERQNKIISKLLQQRGVIKLYALAFDLKVTEGTVSNDLDKVEQWMTGHELELIRKPGLGVYVRGGERKLRRAMVNFLHETIGSGNLLELMRSVGSAGIARGESHNRLLNLIDEEIVRQLEEMIKETEMMIGGRLADNAYVGLTVHLALAVQRIKQQEKIEMDEVVLQDLKRYAEYEVASRLAAVIAERFSIEIPPGEIGYITMHLRGLRNRDGALSSTQPMIGNYELVKAAKEIVRAAEAATGQFLLHNEKLLAGLVNHLGPAISRLKMNLEIRNPLLEEIKTFYPDLIEVSRCCIGALEKQFALTLPEAEIAYLAMHIGAALEDGSRRDKVVYRAVIACPTGLGTSRLLASKIEKEYDNIVIVDVISSLRMEKKWLKEKKIDCILATMPVDDCELPVAILNPLLFAADKKKIEELLLRLKGRKQSNERPEQATAPFSERLKQLGRYQKAALQLLDNFFLLETSENTIEAIIANAAKVKNADREVQLQIEKDLLLREVKGSTIIAEHGFILLHCRSAAVESLHFGAIRLQTPVFGRNGAKIILAIIMLAPSFCNRDAMETISYLSQMLIENPDFLAALQRGGQERAAQAMSIVLEEFYRGKSKALL